MRRIVIVLTALLALSLCSCRTAVAPSAAESSRTFDEGITPNGTEKAETPEVSASEETEHAKPTAASDALCLEDITVEDQEQVRTLISNYFSALEQKDYAAAWQLMSSKQQEIYPEGQAVKEGWGLDEIRLVSVKGYLPPYIAECLPPFEFKVTAVPDGTPTIWFVVELEVKPMENSAWETGINDRFVNVTQEADGSWRIDGLATGP